MSETTPVRVLVLDPRPLFAKTMRACLDKVGHVLLGRASDVAEAKQQIDSLQPDLVILGPHLGETNLLACRELISQQPTLKIILFTAHADDLLFQADAVYVGVTACVCAETTDEGLLEVIATVMTGQKLFSQEILALAFQPIELTERERDVLRFMAEGKSDREIAVALGLKFNTVRNHTRHILEKLNVHSRQKAVLRAQSRGIV